MLQYTIWRILIFAIILLALLWFNVEPLFAALIAALVSMVISFFALARQREEMARKVEDRVETSLRKRRDKADAQRTDEDDEDFEDESGRREQS